MHSDDTIHIKRRIAGFHRLQIGDKPFGPFVAVDKRINEFKTNMKLC